LETYVTFVSIVLYFCRT